MKIKRIGVGLAVVAAATALALTGCTGSSNGSSGSDEINQNQSLTIAQNGPFNAYNTNTANDYNTYNTNVTYMTWASFNYYDSTPKLVKNTKFGTYSVVTKDPLTIKYTVNKGVKWSDGTPVNAADLLIEWASMLPEYNNPKGVNFGSVSAGSVPLATTAPKVSADGQSITFSYSTPYVDWEQLAFNPGVAAHAVYDVAFPGQKLTGVQADKKVETAIESGDTSTLTALAKAWDTGFEFSGNLPSNKELYLSDGPYVITNYVKGQYVTLTRNKDYTWGPVPKVKTLTIRFISDPTAQVQALQNGEVAIIEGQADSDTVASLKQLKGVTTKTEADSTYEHVDLTVNNAVGAGGTANSGAKPGPFDAASYGGGTAGAQKALEVREAFLSALPRQQIVDNLIKPINPNAKLDNSQTFLPGTPGYDQSVANNGSAQYDKVDVAKAKQLLKQAGVTGTVNVRFLYDKSNTRRAQEYALIKSSEAQAGFNVIDDGNPNWSSILGNGSYDASLFAWQYTSLAVTGSEAEIQTNGGNNFTGYSNPTVDANWKTLSSSFNTATQQKALAAIDKEMWSDAYGATLYQFPDVVAYSSTVKGVSYSPLAPNQFWNFWDWSK